MFEVLPEILKTYEVAKRLHVNTRTVNLWAQQGLLRSFLTPGGQRRYPAADVERVRRGMFEHVEYQ